MKKAQGKKPFQFKGAIVKSFAIAKTLIDRLAEWSQIADERIPISNP